MDNLPDYNYLKRLPKDLLIKIIFELNNVYLEDRRKWFIDILKENNLGHCGNPECYEIDHIDGADFGWCEECGITYCRNCRKGNKMTIKFQECDICDMHTCSNCNCGCCDL